MNNELNEKPENYIETKNLMELDLHLKRAISENKFTKVDARLFVESETRKFIQGLIDRGEVYEQDAWKFHKQLLANIEIS